MITTQELMRKLDRCNREAFICLANLESFGRLEKNVMLGLKDWLNETRLLIGRGLQLADGIKLHPREARTDLTDRECAKLLGSLIAGLTQMTDTETVRRAVIHWAASDQSWDILSALDFSVDQRRRRGEAPEAKKQ